MKDNKNHLSSAKLIAYADPAIKKDERLEIASHMEACVSCRDRFISLQKLKNSLRSVKQPVDFYATPGAECLPTELMGDFLGHRLPSEEHSVWSTHVGECDVCFERAAFMADSTMKMFEGALKMEPTPERFKRAVLPKQRVINNRGVEWPFIGNIKDWFASPLPAYAFASVVFLFLLFGPKPNGENLISLDSDNNFTFFERPAQSGPSFGFSGAGKRVGEEIAGLLVEESGANGDLRFRWNEVENFSGSEYSFLLFEMAPDGMRDIVGFKVKGNETLVEAKHLRKGAVYRYKVSGVRPHSGETKGGPESVFFATGQFTIVK